MSNRNHVGYIVRSPASNEMFAWSNKPHRWMERAKTLRSAAHALHEIYVVREKDIRAELSNLCAAATNERGVFALSAQFREGDDHPMMRMVELHRDQMPILFLSGLAIETALKALWVQRESTCVANGVGPLGHRQVDLAGNAGINLSETERMLLFFLTDVVTFAGRYPTAAKASDAHSSMMIGDNVFMEFDSMFERLLSEYNERASQESKGEGRGE